MAHGGRHLAALVQEALGCMVDAAQTIYDAKNSRPYVRLEDYQNLRHLAA